MHSHVFASDGAPVQAFTTQLSIRVSRPDAASLVITPVGEADLYTVGALREALSQAVDEGRPTVIVDLDELTFMDATTLGALVSARARTCAAGRTFQVRCAADHPGRRLLSATGLEALLTAGG